jgi:hypothetical protein
MVPAGENTGEEKKVVADFINWYYQKIISG